MDNSTEFFDISTVYGKFKLIASRLNWRWIVPTLLMSIFLLVWITVAIHSPANTNSNPNVLKAVPSSPLQAPEAISSNTNTNAKPTQSPSSKPVKIKPTKAPKKPGMYYFYGDGATPFTGLDEIFWLNKTTLINLEIHNTVIWDGASVTNSLNESLSLESINMDLLQFYGGFTRVYLPNLEDFKFNLNTISEVDIEKYRQTEEIKGILFFDKTNSSVNENGQNGEISLAPGVNVSISAGGVKILELNRAEGLVTINIPDCTSMLQSITRDSSIHFTRLTLSWCDIEDNYTMALLPNSITTSLNLHNALPSDQPGLDKLMAEVSKQGSLQEFYAYLPAVGNPKFRDYYISPSDPYRQYEINVQDIPSSVTRLSLSKIGLSNGKRNGNSSSASSSSSSTSSSVTDLTLEGCNVTGIIDNFEIIFARVKTVTLFNIKSTPDNLQYKLLNKVFATQVTTVLVTGLKRLSPGYDADADQVEATLKTFIVDGYAEDFMVTRLPSASAVENGNNNSNNLKDGSYTMDDSSNTVAGFSQPVVGVQRNWKRFDALGFKDIDTFNYYLEYDNAGSFPCPSMLITFFLLMVSTYFINT